MSGIIVDIHILGGVVFLIVLLSLSCRTSIDDSEQKVTELDTSEEEGASLIHHVVWNSSERAYSTGGAFADIDGDGFLDVVVSEGNDMEPGFVRVYFNSNGTVETEASFVSAHPQYYGHLAVGDLNADGLTDVVVSKFLGATRFYEPGGVEVFLNHGGMLYSEPDWVWNGAYSFAVALGDIDHDYDVDIVIAAGEAYYNDPEHSLGFCNNGRGEFTLCWETDSPRYSFDAAFVDLNRDGWQDLVFANHGEGHTIHLGTESLPSTSPSWQATGDGFEGNTLDWGDINSDGFLDIVVSDNNQLGGAGILRGWCGPNFVLCWQSQDEPLMQSAVLLRDFDLDGDIDVAAGAWWGPLRFYEQIEGFLDAEPVFVEANNAIVAEAMGWAPLSASTTAWETSGLWEIPGRKAVAGASLGVWAEGYAFGEEIDIHLFELENMHLLLTDWEPDQGNAMFAREPRE